VGYSSYKETYGEPMTVLPRTSNNYAMANYVKVVVDKPSTDFLPRNLTKYTN